jgi:hypothetical protein
MCCNSIPMLLDYMSRYRGAAAVAAALQTGLTALDLAGNGILAGLRRAGPAAALPEFRALCAALARLPRLADLDLSGNGVAPRAALDALAPCLAAAAALRSLALGGRPPHSDSPAEPARGGDAAAEEELGPAGAAALGPALERCGGRLRALDLSWARLGPAGAAELARGLRAAAAAGLVRLELHAARLGDAGAAAVAGALREAAAAPGAGPLRLTHLGLGRNSVGDPGATALAAALERMPGLTSLRLGHSWLAAATGGGGGGGGGGADWGREGGDWNTVGCAGATAVAAALGGAAAASLTALALDGCEVSGPGARALAALAAAATGLAALRLEGNPVPPPARAAVRAAVLRNQQRLRARGPAAAAAAARAFQ